MFFNLKKQTKKNVELHRKLSPIYLYLQIICMSIRINESIVFWNINGLHTLVYYQQEISNQINRKLSSVSLKSSPQQCINPLEHPMSLSCLSSYVSKVLFEIILFPHELILVRCPSSLDGMKDESAHHQPLQGSVIITILGESESQRRSLFGCEE